MNESLNWELLAKYLSDECTAHEKNEMETWIYADPENQQLLEYLKTSWNIAEPDIQTTDTKRLWKHLSEKAGIESGYLENIHLPLKKPDRGLQRQSVIAQLSQSPIWRYAAVVLIFLLSALYIFSGNLTSLLGLKGKTEIKTISLENGQRESITLSDGSKITLDAGSTFSFPTKFSGDRREVSLTGEAFFEVVSNPDKPFTVIVNQAAIEVVGTKFNIRAWQQEQKITVTVTEGKILLHPEKVKSETSISLNQGYASTLPENGQPSAPQIVDALKATGWMKNEIYFEDTALSEILGQLERWYDVKFVTQDSTIIHDRLNVHLANRSLEDHLNLLGELVNVHFFHTGQFYRLVPM